MVDFGVEFVKILELHTNRSKNNQNVFKTFKFIHLKLPKNAETHKVSHFPTQKKLNSVASNSFQNFKMFGFYYF